jgi:hypothetical protein
VARLIIPPGYGMWDFRMRLLTYTHVCHITGAFNTSDAWSDTATADLYAQLVVVFQNLHTEDVFYDGLKVSIGQDGGPPQVWEHNGVETGAAAFAVPAPPQTAYLLSKRTGFGGRQNRGRLYIPFVPSNWVDGVGTLVGGAPAALNTAGLLLPGTFLVPPMAGAVILHSGSAVPTPITSWHAEGIVATQRRRLVRS